MALVSRCMLGLARGALDGFVSLALSAVNRQTHSEPPLRERLSRESNVCPPYGLTQDITGDASSLINES